MTDTPIRVRAGRLKTAAAMLATWLILLPVVAGAQERPEFATWLDGVREEALARGISKATIDLALDGIEPVARILERDRNQAEFQLTFAQYRDRVVRPEVVARGRKMAARHHDLLHEVAARYGVQPRFVLAIWGIETRFGAIDPTMPVIPAVATLAYDVRRSSYFREQLMSALLMIDRGYIDLASMKGSWAGAMGQVQFMPASYLNYAVDFDGDGRRDIWDTTADVLGSIANYLAEHGWRDDLTWGRPVRLPAGLSEKLTELRDTKAKGCRAMREMTIEKPLSEWQAMGVRRLSGADLPTREVMAAVVQPDGPEGPSFLVYRNYKAILGYNCAHLYALTVGALADRIAGR